MYKLLTRIAFVLFFLLFTTSLFAITKNDVKVIRVIDGDTFIINDNLNHIRMANIDAPEKKQTYGYQSYLVLKDKLEGRVVTLDILSKDKYGRLISNVY
ncbi:thermonuclease family protein, partial [Enterobacter kobei]|uniref:thermonuclease family protein n=1 Tax=Enterobacter kobei TaxID=208224 RepID=UPI000AE93755